MKFHLYGGLLCSSYLIIFGLTSLRFNHPGLFPAPGDETVTWERQLDIENQDDNLELAQSIRRQLGLMGWTPWWEWDRDDQNNLSFVLSRPAKRYHIDVRADENRVQVREIRMGYWTALMSLHAMMQLPGSSLIPWWGVYTELCTWFVLFAAVTGVYLWATQKRDRIMALVTLLTLAAGSLLFMLYIWAQG